MFGSTKPLRYVGAAVALTALVGTTALDWEFGAGDPVPMALGVAAAGLGLGWGLYRRAGVP